MIPVIGAWYVTLMSVLFVLVCLFLILVVLIQKPKGGGLAGAFGGSGGGGETAFGAKTGDVLTWFTCVMFGMFLLLAMGLTWTIHPDLDVSTQTITIPAGTDAATPGTPGNPESLDLPIQVTTPEVAPEATPEAAPEAPRSGAPEGTPSATPPAAAPEAAAPTEAPATTPAAEPAPTEQKP